MVDVVNTERPGHIMTVEDPIEFLHKHKTLHREPARGRGRHARLRRSALKHVLRQDPDVILVGEMRDLETISTAITAAETGHLVFATLHTQDAPQTIDRIIDVFPPHQQQQVRVQLSTTLQGVVTQQLLPTADGQGRAVACEVLVATPAIRNLIREGKVHQIYSSMQAGGRYGMQTMDMSLAQHVKAGRISQELAFERCHDAEELQRLIGGGRHLATAASASMARGGMAMAACGGGMTDGRDVGTRWHRPSSTRSATEAGNLVTGTLVADSELLVLQRLREMGYTPLEVGKEKKGLNLEINVKKKKVKLKDLVGLLAAVRHDDQLGPADPAGARRSSRTRPRTPSSPRRSTACRMDVEQGASLSGAMQKHPKVFNDLYISMVKSGETGGSLDNDPAAARGDARARGAPARQDQVGDDLPGRRGRARRADHVGDAAVRRPAVQEHLRAARRHAAAADAGAAHDVRADAEVLVHRRADGDRRAVLRSAGTRRPTNGREAGRPLQAAGAGVRVAVPQDRALAVLEHARDAADSPACRSCRPSTS